MDIGSLSIILIVGLLLLISIGVPMGFASGFMGAVLVFLYIGEHALGILLSRYYSLVVTYSFLSVPLFIFMASLLERSNIARDLYDALNAWLRKTRGGNIGQISWISVYLQIAYLYHHPARGGWVGVCFENGPVLQPIRGATRSFTDPNLGE